MTSIAVVGPDGAGKTSVTRRLVESEGLRLRYLYMGINTGSSNIALPTSRLAERWKRHPRVPGRRPGIAWIAARLVNRVAEQWYRQLVSWYYQARGFTVVYDRHFRLDFAGGPPASALRTDQRLYRWCLAHLTPRPGLVIMLDAPAEVLFARKGESTVAELERRRQALLREGARLPAFVRIDATRALDAVYDDVARCVRHYCLDRAGFLRELHAAVGAQPSALSHPSPDAAPTAVSVTGACDA